MILLKFKLMHQLGLYGCVSLIGFVGLLKTKVVQGVNNFFCCIYADEFFDYAFESNKWEIYL